MQRGGFLRSTELDRTNYPDFRDGILSAEHGGEPLLPRSYPSYPKVRLDVVRPRLWPALDRALTERRCMRSLDSRMPSRKTLSRILRFSHGIIGNDARGPVPSAGGLQALELFVATFEPSWLGEGIYHYDRTGHHLSRIANAAPRSVWDEKIPSLAQTQGGALLWIIAGDVARVAEKYGDRGYRFLLLEAGHLMQNLCVMSSSLNLSVVPLGGFFEQEIAKISGLPSSDAVLYLGVCGKPIPAP